MNSGSALLTRRISADTWTGHCGGLACSILISWPYFDFFEHPTLMLIFAALFPIVNDDSGSTIDPSSRRTILFYFRDVIF
jgi:hypothetical protein